jgi:hypothetical protein
MRKTEIAADKRAHPKPLQDKAQRPKPANVSLYEDSFIHQSLERRWPKLAIKSMGYGSCLLPPAGAQFTKKNFDFLPQPR